MFEFGDTKYNHWFDGQSLLHSFTINKGKIHYRSHYLHSKTFKTNTAANRIVVSEFGTLAYPDPRKTLLQRMKATLQMLSPNYEPSDNNNFNLYPLGDDIVVAQESNIIHIIDPITLDTKDRINLSKYVAINGATGHPHIEADGTVYNLATTFKMRPKTCVIMLPSNGDISGQATATQRKGKIICTLPVKREQPAYFNIPLILGSRMFGKAGRKIKPVFTDKEEEVCFHIVEKKTGQELELRFVTESFFTFHHINAYEDNGHVVVDLCCTTDDSYCNFGFFDSSASFIPDERRQSVRRYVLPLNTSTKNLVTLNYSCATAILQDDGSIYCQYEILSPIAFEYPRINYPVCNGKQYRFVYGVAGLDKLVKLDTREKTVKMWAEKACFPSEPVFVSRPLADREDDGVILSAVIDTELGHHPFLLVLDSITMSEIGRAEFKEVKFPKDLHGIFLRNIPVC
ncbi:hypothetical protein EMCRGX_G011241 [Ephydatia muelleri]